jgi:hypothetical protein
MLPQRLQKTTSARTSSHNLNLHLKPARQTSYAHHFRTLVPPNAAARGDRNIVFLSSIHVASPGIHSYLAALWSYAYLEDKLHQHPKLLGQAY